MAIMISIFMGNTALGTLTKRPAIAIANTARTSQVSISTNSKNIIRTLIEITCPVISAIEHPYSLMLITNAPKSCRTPIKMVPKMTHNKAGSQPQKAAIQGPIIGAPPAMEVK